MVEYDSTSQNLSYGKNNEDLKVVFQNVVKQAKDLYPMVLFTRRNNTTTVRKCGLCVAVCHYKG